MCISLCTCVCVCVLMYASILSCVWLFCVLIHVRICVILDTYIHILYYVSLVSLIHSLFLCISVSMTAFLLLHCYVGVILPTFVCLYISFFFSHLSVFLLPSVFSQICWTFFCVSLYVIFCIFIICGSLCFCFFLCLCMCVLE